MAHAVIRRSVKAKTRVRDGSVHMEFVADRVALDLAEGIPAVA
jgi:hypothetical protein